MKKIYIEPKMDVVTIRCNQMIAASPNGEGIIVPDSEPVNPNDFDSRSSNGLWDD